MQKPHLPTLICAGAVILGAIIVYHIFFNRG